ncbi:MAG: NUDIX domain-containing protein [Chitinophagaceae bacterium]|jgi:8-oxo-dGTP pyrophosphatase MutT (NUDIX family)|nr:NUDIX domain-containing protein [Chitinophagaceae bacterium]
MIKQFSTSVLVFKKLTSPLEILLIFHKKLNKWMVPGGHVEPNENPAECAIREVREETGIEISLFSFIHKKLLNEDSVWILPPEYLFEQIIPKLLQQEMHIHIDCVYIGVSLSTELKINHNEIENVKWVSINETNSLDMFDGTRKIINEVLNKINTGILPTYQ